MVGAAFNNSPKPDSLLVHTGRRVPRTHGPQSRFLGHQSRSSMHHRCRRTADCCATSGIQHHTQPHFKEATDILPPVQQHIGIHGCDAQQGNSCASQTHSGDCQLALQPWKNALVSCNDSKNLGQRMCSRHQRQTLSRHFGQSVMQRVCSCGAVSSIQHQRQHRHALHSSRSLLRHGQSEHVCGTQSRPKQPILRDDCRHRNLNRQSRHCLNASCMPSSCSNFRQSPFRWSGV